MERRNNLGVIRQTEIIVTAKRQYLAPINLLSRGLWSTKNTSRTIQALLTTSCQRGV
jgi:hypothetical protein